MKVLITGVTGQDGSNMIRFLLNKYSNIEIFGAIRRLSVQNHENIIDIIDNRFNLVNLDITDQQSIINNIKNLKPDYVLNFAAQSFVGESWNTPIQTFTTNTLSVMYFLEAIREFVPTCRFYSAGSSEEFGDVDYVPQDINHPCKPRSPYGASKCAARHIVKVYRESYNLYAIHCILFNHEGIRRGKEFVTRKITSNIARIKKELESGQEPIPFELGNIYAKRDWSDSEDFVEAVWLMMNQEKPREYVLSSNETHTVKEFIDLACKYANLDIEWQEDMIDETNTVLLSNGQIIMKISEKFYRPAEVDLLYGDSTETRLAIGWEPKISFEGLVKRMTEWDINLLNKNIVNSDIDTLKKCRLCNSKNIVPSIDLGTSTYSGIFPKKDEFIPKVQISLCKCMNCGLVQLYNLFNIEYMYGETYGYRSGLNKSMIDHLTNLAREIESVVKIEKNDNILDIGANDGTLLNNYNRDKKINFYGIDPSCNKFKQYHNPDLNIINDFFNYESIYDKYGPIKFKVITSISCFYDLPDISKFVQDIKFCLAQDGFWISEQSYLLYMIKSNSYDTICHEHLEYYAVKQFKFLCDKYSLKIVNISENYCNGGSFRIYITHSDNMKYTEYVDLNKYLINEDQLRYNTLEPLNGLNNFMLSHKLQIRELFDNIKKEDKIVHGYGASTKGNILLQYCNITTEDIKCFAEVNPDKFGKYTPGTNIPIISEEESLNMKPDYYFVCPWHFKESILAREIEKLKSGIKFIFPLPDINIVSYDDIINNKPK
jgi:GDP-mannose 4,6-dehydratase